MTMVDDLIRKAETALSSARHLLDVGDAEGAADRAFYGLFHAARAFLLHVAAAEKEKLKTHTSIIAAFGLIGVKGGGFVPQPWTVVEFCRGASPEGRLRQRSVRRWSRGRKHLEGRACIHRGHQVRYREGLMS